MDGGAWWATVHGVTKSQTQLSYFTFTFYSHALEKEIATHSSVLALRIPGTGEPVGLPSVGLHRVGHHWSDSSSSRILCQSTLYTCQRLFDLLWKYSDKNYCLGNPTLYCCCSCLIRYNPMDCTLATLPSPSPRVCSTHVHWVADAIQPFHPLSSPSPPAFNLSQHQGLFQWVASLHQEAKVLLCYVASVMSNSATPQTAAHQASLSLGFSRQEHWSGLPFPSPMQESEKWKWSRSVVSNS